MTASGPPPLLAAAAYLLPALVWSVVAHAGWQLRREKKPAHGFFRLLPIVAALVTLLYLSLALFCLIPAELQQHPPGWLITLYKLSNVVHVAMAATVLHLTVYFSLQTQRPSVAWLAADYVSAAVMATLAMFPGLIPAPTIEDSLSRFFVIRNLYIFAMLVLVVRQLARVARRGAWRPGRMGEARSTDIAVLAVGVVGAGGWFLLAVFANLRLPPPGWLLLYDMTVALCLAAPIAVRVLGEVVRRVLLTTILALATVGIYFGGHTGAAALAERGLDMLAHAFALGALLLLLMPGQHWLREAIERIVFRRTRRRREELHAAVQALSPTLGSPECGRRALADLCRILHLSGAALLLADGTRVAEGTTDIEPLRRVWPQDADPPPHLETTFAQYAIPVPHDDVREALAAANVVGVAPVASTQRLWGYLFISTGFLGATFGDDDARALDDFAGQLALLLDGTELLARALAVERSLAHAEKLAAIGELAARVAHEIRNPVTAARSLAQQLAREPASPFHEEHALILTELERVEHQVAALLRFARREQFDFEPVDLPELARATLATFGPRLEAAHIAVSFESSDDHVTARADREKMRQVLVNLIENAIDALTSSNGDRQLGVTVGTVNGSATLRVTDSGPGVPADALPHLFEPFFSLKATGTGLGLAIAKRTVDAHGGRIAIGSAAGAGTSVQVELPLGNER
jgi:signal transduction histidine kinase